MCLLDYLPGKKVIIMSTCTTTVHFIRERERNRDCLCVCCYHVDMLLQLYQHSLIEYTLYINNGIVKSLRERRNGGEREGKGGGH